MGRANQEESKARIAEKILIQSSKVFKRKVLTNAFSQFNHTA